MWFVSCKARDLTLWEHFRAAMACGPGAEEQLTRCSLEETVRVTGTPRVPARACSLPSISVHQGIRPRRSDKARGSLSGVWCITSHRTPPPPSLPGLPQAPDTQGPVLTRRGALLKLVIEVQRQHQHVGQDVVHGRVGLQGGPRALAAVPGVGPHASTGQPGLMPAGGPEPQRSGLLSAVWNGAGGNP